MRLRALLLSLVVAIATVASGIAAGCEMAGEPCCPADILAIASADECPVTPGTPMLDPTERSQPVDAALSPARENRLTVPREACSFVIARSETLDGAPPGVLVLRI